MHREEEIKKLSSDTEEATAFSINPKGCQVIAEYLYELGYRLTPSLPQKELREKIIALIGAHGDCRINLVTTGIMPKEYTELREIADQILSLISPVELPVLTDEEIKEVRIEGMKSAYYDIHSDLMSVTCKDNFESMQKRVTQLLYKVQEKMANPGSQD